MKQFLNSLAIIALLFFGALGVTGCVTTGGANFVPANREYRPISGPPARSVSSPYLPAMICLRDHMTPAQRQDTWAVGSFPDNTGKVNYTSEGTGAVISQGLREMLTTSLGIILPQSMVDLSPDYQRQFAFSTIVARRQTEYTRLPTYIVNGAMTSADFSGGGGVSLRSPVNVTNRMHRVMMGFDARVTTMPFDRNEAGIILTTFRYTKQIVGVENEVGLTTFFGNTLVNLTAGQENRGFIQDSARYMMDIVAFRAVRDVTGITDCDELFYNAEEQAGITRDEMPAPQRIAIVPQQPQRSTGLAQQAPAPAPAHSPAPQPSAAATPRAPQTPSPTTTATASPTPAPVASTTTPPGSSTPQPATLRTPATDSVAAAVVRTPAAYVHPTTPSASVPRGEATSQGTSPSGDARNLIARTETRSSVEPTAAVPRSPKNLAGGARTRTHAAPAAHQPPRALHAANYRSSNSHRPALRRLQVIPPVSRAARLGLRGRFVAISYRPCAHRRCVLRSKRSRLVQTRRIQGRLAWTGNENLSPQVLGGTYQRPSG